MSKIDEAIKDGCKECPKSMCMWGSFVGDCPYNTYNKSEPEPNIEDADIVVDLSGGRLLVKSLRQRINCLTAELHDWQNSQARKIKDLQADLKTKDKRTTTLEHWLQHAIAILEAAEERPDKIANDWNVFLMKALEQALKG